MALVDKEDQEQRTKTGRKKARENATCTQEKELKEGSLYSNLCKINHKT